MHWVSMHPYATALGIAGLLLISGTALVEYRSGVTPLHASRTWGGESNLIDPFPTANNPVVDGPMFSAATNTPFIFYSAGSESSVNAATTLDEIFAELLQKPKSTATQPKTEPGTLDFIPSGLVSVETSTEQRTELQQSLYEYGNEVGSYIQSYEDLNRGSPQTLRNQAEDRTDAAKGEAVRRIGSSISNIGEHMRSMESVPPLMSAAHAALAESYIDAGASLSRIPDAKDDGSFLSAVEQYNATADLFTKRFISLALLFSAHGVAFSEHDSGSVFTFKRMGL